MMPVKHVFKKFSTAYRSWRRFHRLTGELPIDPSKHGSYDRAIIELENYWIGQSSAYNIVLGIPLKDQETMFSTEAQENVA